MFKIETINNKRRISTEKGTFGEVSDVANMFEWGTVFLKKNGDDSYHHFYFVDFNMNTYYWEIRKWVYADHDSYIVGEGHGLEALCDLLNKGYQAKFRVHEW